MSPFAIGVDLGGTSLRIAAVDSGGTLLEKVTTGTKVAMGRDHVIGEMADAIRSIARKFSASGRLSGIGIGVPGIIDLDTGMLRESPNLPGWHNYPVREEIERRLKTQVILENDANAAAFGEKWLGAAQEVDSMCMLTLGTGVGGGIVLDGKIWHGMKGMAGELGHMNVEPEGPPCGCGSRGCIEQLASATAIKRMAVEAVATGNAPELGRAMREDPEFSAKVVYQMAVQGDEPAQRIFTEVGRALGIVVADLVNIFNLPMYVIGGGVASAWEAFSPAMLAEVQSRSFVYRATVPKPNQPPGAKKTLVTRALLGSDAGLYGAARLPMLTKAADARTVASRKRA
ncbi:MAG: ROK family protein [Acidobacteriales bacterium]|nr:ROK family protein [Terriglobales bacterium]